MACSGVVLEFPVIYLDYMTDFEYYNQVSKGYHEKWKRKYKRQFEKLFLTQQLVRNWFVPDECPIEGSKQDN
jgi:hypothetical protein